MLVVVLPRGISAYACGVVIAAFVVIGIAIVVSVLILAWSSGD